MPAAPRAMAPMKSTCQTLGPSQTLQMPTVVTKAPTAVWCGVARIHLSKLSK